MLNVKFRTCLCSWLETVSSKLHGFRTCYIMKYSGLPTLCICGILVTKSEFSPKPWTINMYFGGAEIKLRVLRHKILL